MMGRPHIEILQSQWLPWSCEKPVSYHGVEAKILSRDDATGAVTCLRRFSAGWRLSDRHALSCDEEIFILSGGLRINEVDYTVHDYAFFPEGFPRHLIAVFEDTIVLTYTSEAFGIVRTEDRVGRYDATALIEHCDTTGLKWDQTNIDPNINHLNASRKNLRFAPDNSCRTYLLGGMPQGFPAEGLSPSERHPHVEEFFLVSGDMSTHAGIMRPGAYFWRPPEIWHGQDCTRSGFLLLCRTPGSNKTISEWTKDSLPVSYTPEFRPNLTEAQLALNPKPLNDPTEY